MKNTYRALAYLVAAGVFVQAAAIAWAIFTIANDVEAGAVLTSDSASNTGQELHGTVGMMVIPALALILFVVSLFAKIPGGVKYAAIIVGLVVLQITLAFVAFGAPVVGALHGMNALAILGVSITAASRVSTAPLSAADETEAHGRSIIRRRASA
jgi:hypothetical protein